MLYLYLFTFKSSSKYVICLIFLFYYFLRKFWSFLDSILKSQNQNFIYSQEKALSWNLHTYSFLIDRMTPEWILTNMIHNNKMCILIYFFQK